MRWRSAFTSASDGRIVFPAQTGLSPCVLALQCSVRIPAIGPDCSIFHCWTATVRDKAARRMDSPLC